MSQISFLEFIKTTIATDPTTVTTTWKPEFSQARFNGATALHFACRGGPGADSETIVSSLLNLGCDIESQTNVFNPDLTIGSRPLHVAARFNNVGAMRALLARHCDIGAKDGMKQTAFKIANEKGHRECRILLQSAWLHHDIAASTPDLSLPGGTVLEHTTNHFMRLRLVMSSSVPVLHGCCKGEVEASGGRLVRVQETSLSESYILSSSVPEQRAICKCQAPHEAAYLASTLSLPNVHHAEVGAAVQPCPSCLLRRMDCALSCGHRCCYICASNAHWCSIFNTAITSKLRLLN